MVVFNHLQQFFLKRITLSKKKEHPIYILPTANGLKVLGLNFLLLVIGLIYANNYVLLFNFLLFCLVLSSMFYTHHNLKFIQLKSAFAVSGYKKELAMLNVVFFTNNKQNNYNIVLKMMKEDHFNNTNFSIEHLPFQKNTSFEIPLDVLKRGRAHITGVFLETDFPLGFFRCFTFFPIHQDVVLYPARIAHHSLSLKNQEQTSNHLLNDDDQIHYRSYQLGDSINRLDWKRYAKNGQMNVLFQQPLEQLQHLIHITIEPEEDQNIVELKLEQATFELYQAFQDEKEFGLMINKSLIFELGSGKEHLEQCLKYLGLYEH